MKTGANWCWVAGCWVLLAVGGLFSCNGGQQKADSAAQGTNAQQPSTGYQNLAEIDSLTAKPKKPFNPKAGRIPTTKADYDSALKAVKRYKVKFANNVYNNFFSRGLADSILRNKDCVGFRVYRADSVGKGNSNYLRIVVIGVDKNGRDITTPVKLVDDKGLPFEGKYLFGVSAERCPDNCEGCELYQ